MASAKRLVPIDGGEPSARFTAQAIGPANPNERITVTVKVRSRDDKGAEAALAGPGHKAVRRDQFEAVHGADPATITKVEDFARGAGLTVVESSAAKRRVVLTGTVAQFEAAFGVKMQRFRHPGGTYRSHDGVAQVPADIQPEIEAVLGLSTRPLARPHFQYRRPARVLARGLRMGQPSPLSPLDVSRLYDFPTSPDGGAGQCIAIIELGGGFLMDDLQTYFNALGVPMPEVVDVSVLGAANSPGQDADGEVMLDIEVAGAVAPKAKIVVYFAPNTDQGFIQAITDAAHDAVNKPSVISVSWGGPEAAWRKSTRTAMSNAIRDAGLMGVTVTVAAGDNGSADGVQDGKTHVDFPASSPYALACGGTRLQGTGSTIASESVWNDGPDSATGGGVSDAFPVPTYQNQANVPTSLSKPGFRGRGVPDVAGDADPMSGYKVRVDGQDTVVGGTSAVAPLWAGLIALMNQQLGQPLGFMNPTLYGSASAVASFHQITDGNNGAFSAGAGWNPCTGLGTPDGAHLLAALKPGGQAHPKPHAARPTAGAVTPPTRVGP